MRRNIQMTIKKCDVGVRKNKNKIHCACAKNLNCEKNDFRFSFTNSCNKNIILYINQYIRIVKYWL